MLHCLNGFPPFSHIPALRQYYEGKVFTLIPKIKHYLKQILINSQLGLLRYQISMAPLTLVLAIEYCNLYTT